MRTSAPRTALLCSRPRVRFRPTTVREWPVQRGGALLAVLWLSAALSAIAFSVANSVRGETERASTHADSVRAYYLAAGAVDRALLYMQWGPAYRNPDGSPRYYAPDKPFLRMPFPAGEVFVEVIPETSKLNINTAPAEELLRLMLASGIPPGQADEIVAGIVDWRSAVPPGAVTPFDQYYLSLAPSFRARHASFQEIEELLLVKGMTPDLFYGSYERGPEGNLIPRGGLRDCLSIYGALAGFDVNTVSPVLMAAIGLTPNSIAAILERRRVLPFRSAADLAPLAEAGGPGFRRLAVSAGTIFTIRATAQLRIGENQLSDLRRSVAAVVKYPTDFAKEPPYTVLRWYDNTWVDLRAWQ
ncbi:MAG: general secretion pathway protein GspK [Bryobacteraceae bacterium]|nr:general secretion pathway protein GspK [Bryobacterales bacterium]MEB2362885.1 type II secretion system protein GspK [Bryobacterales bacterium]NUN00902.1 general secretion pathway protein GspK [Bryobacteraceae bacterium]